MGVFTWDVACTGPEGPFVLQVPRVIDEPGYRGRARRDVPRRNVETMRQFLARGLGRFVAAPIELVDLPGGVPAAMLSALPAHRPITFGRGAVQVELAEDELSWLISLGPRPTAELLAEIVAALATTTTATPTAAPRSSTSAINDGDFVARRRADDSGRRQRRRLRRPADRRAPRSKRGSAPASSCSTWCRCSRTRTGTWTTGAWWGCRP